MNVTKQDLFNMILVLQERLDLIDGRPRGPITMREARLANERGDKATLQLYYRQFEQNVPKREDPAAGPFGANEDYEVSPGLSRIEAFPAGKVRPMPEVGTPCGGK
jgi:hypothetical protein